MKKMRIVSILVAVMFFFTWVVPPILAEEAGDKLIEIFKKDVKPPVDLLPEGVEIVEGFEPGEGASIGTAKKLKGKILVIHKGAKVAYELKKGQDLFTGDMLISGEDSSIHAKLIDKSVFSLAPYSKMILDKFIYDPEKDSRDSFVSLLFGKARFIASKLIGSRDDDFRVKTPTAYAGVRGSDFAISVVPVEELSASRSDWLNKLSLVSEAHAQVNNLATTILAGEETRLSVIGEDEAKTEVIVESMSVTRVIAGMAPIVPLAVMAALVIEALTIAGPALGSMAGAGIGLGTYLAGGAIAVAGVAAASSGGGGGGGGGSTATTTTTTTTSTTTTTTPTTSTTTTTLQTNPNATVEWGDYPVGGTGTWVPDDAFDLWFAGRYLGRSPIGGSSGVIQVAGLEVGVNQLKIKFVTPNAGVGTYCITLGGGATFVAGGVTQKEGFINNVNDSHYFDVSVPAP